MNQQYCQPAPVALTIAGSDSGGGAGVQADLKTFSALNTYGCSVITALTAQNTQGVAGIFDVSAEFVRAQLDAVLSDISVNAIKTGMLSRAGVIDTITDALTDNPVERLVVDPVMIATSGDKLLRDDAITILKQRLLPKAMVLTPNLAEAAILLNSQIPVDLDEMEAMLEPLLALGPRSVLLKGGHLNSEQSIDLFHDGTELLRLSSPRYPTKNTHGTGCTLSSAITALLARGYPLHDAVAGSKEYITKAIAHADRVPIGHGRGPVHHFAGIWRDESS